MNIRLNKKIVAAAAGVAALGAGSFLLVGGASASQSIVASKTNPVYWTCLNKTSHQPANGIRVYDGTNTYPGCSGNYDKAWWSEQGPAGADGTNGSNGSDATLTVSATTAAGDRQDSGTAGNWAIDTLNRTVTVTRDHEVSASKCGAGAATCYHYFGTVTDQGSFLTIAGANSPEAGTPINGRVSGTITGNSGIEFYASSDTPDASLVPATSSGNAIATGDWAKQLFPAGTVVTTATQPTWGYTYQASATCEQWTNASAGNSGDIQGVNHCTS